ncbi:uncharacterized protein MYCFIDRAFT_180262 [Pseudocercospora fijiensis CIRAD86]|uniref:Uncharacterized protein n=1 Tax=Pseudocercospora fijiensis (strain CIRAD86) TaxID=383855 RepID=M2YH16_PSEFD|nr:uncharacterized protein MYCFIDRAFT_180262 [Pseudocercospora fijiensis CIRAD86]EME77115.1 hypothetical protein MYCFIDRAFT_180262 [Pseudocercospora fijiensis CIRAD86]
MLMPEPELSVLRTNPASRSGIGMQEEGRKERTHQPSELTPPTIIRPGRHTGHSPGQVKTQMTFARRPFGARGCIWKFVHEKKTPQKAVYTLIFSPIPLIDEFRDLKQLLTSAKYVTRGSGERVRSPHALIKVCTQSGHIA